MHAINFEGTNTVFGKPESMTDEECTSLHAYRSNETNPMHPFVLTAWMPNVDDLKALNEGRPIYMKTLGHGFTPTALFTLDENGNCNEDY